MLIMCQNSGSASDKAGSSSPVFVKNFQIQRLELQNKRVFKLTRIACMNPVKYIVEMGILHVAF